MEAFLRRAFRPMLLTERKQPLDGEGWLSELKLDGIRCLAYLDADTSDLRNKRNLPLLPTFPELEGLHQQTHGQCVLDGELILTDAQGKPDFEALQARSLTCDRARVQLLSRQAPATFVAFDILALNGDDLTGRPLRERREDIPLLVAHFTEKCCKENDLPLKTFSTEALNYLVGYEWPGNVRQLQNVVERCVVLVSGQEITLEQLPPEIRDEEAQFKSAVDLLPVQLDLADTLERIEAALIRRALVRADFIQANASKLLGISKSLMQYKLKKYGITGH